MTYFMIYFISLNSISKSKFGYLDYQFQSVQNDHSNFTRQTAQKFCLHFHIGVMSDKIGYSTISIFEKHANIHASVACNMACFNMDECYWQWKISTFVTNQTKPYFPRPLSKLGRSLSKEVWQKFGTLVVTAKLSQ